MEQDLLCCNMIRGRVFLAKRKPGGIYRDIKEEIMAWVGNVTAFNISQTTEEITQFDGTRLGGDACSLRVPDTRTITLTMACFKARNIAMALNGEGSYENVEATGTVEDEAHTVVGIGDTIFTEFLPTGTGVTVTDDGDPATTFTVEDDYIITNQGIYIPVGSSIPPDSTILITYQYSIQTVIDLMNKSADDYYLVLAGTDYGSNNRPVRLELYNVNFGGTESMDIINESEFATFDLVGNIKADDSIPISAASTVTGQIPSDIGRWIVGPVPA